MPCMIASLVASGFAAGMGVTPETFHVVDIPKLTIETGLKMGARWHGPRCREEPDSGAHHISP